MVYAVFLFALLAGQRQSGLGVYADNDVARGDADVAREERKTDEEEVELTAITLYLHLAGLELRGGRCAGGVGGRGERTCRKSTSES